MGWYHSWSVVSMALYPVTCCVLAEFNKVCFHSTASSTQVLCEKVVVEVSGQAEECYLDLELCCQSQDRGGCW